MKKIESLALRATTGALALGLATAAISGCSEPDEQRSWNFAVVCEDNAQPQIVDTQGPDFGIDGDKPTVVIDVSCYGDEGFSTPLSIEGLDSAADTSTDGVVTLEAATQGDIKFGPPMQEPVVSTSMHPDENLARIEIAGIKYVETPAYIS